MANKDQAASSLLFGVIDPLRRWTDPHAREELQCLTVLTHASRSCALTTATLSIPKPGISKPLLVVQGKNDPRVIKVELDEIVAAVKKNGVPVDYLVFDDEGHGFSKKKNQISAYGTILQFLDKHLKGATPPQTSVPPSR